MSHGTVTKEVNATLCDLCGKEIPKDLDSGERGSITKGWLAHPVSVPTTKHAWLMWPGPGWLRRADWSEKQKPENRERTYDLHGQCIVDLVEANLFSGVES